MRSQWFIWILVAGVGVFILFIFNYQGQQDSISLSEIFPDQRKEDIEFEFVNEPEKEEAPAKIAKSVKAATQSSNANQAQPAQVQMAARVGSANTTPPPNLAQATSQKPMAPVNQPPAVRKPVAFGKVEQPEVGRSPQGAPKTSAMVKAPYTIQLASYQNRNTAEMALRGIQAAGQPAYMVTKDLGTKGTWYRIYVGQYDTKAAANEKLSELKPKYKDSLVVSP